LLTFQELFRFRAPCLNEKGAGLRKYYGEQPGDKEQSRDNEILFGF
jgi:hypothetical protein